MENLSTIESTRRTIGCSLSYRHSAVTRFRLVVGALVLLLGCAGPVAANQDIEELLARTDAPHGVVFEIVEADEAALETLLPRVLAAIERIRARFPATEFALVSHGREEFALQTKHQTDYARIHQLTQSLAADDIPLHVCETHAGWYGVTAEDFPDYVNVAPTGPGQINLYLGLGYELVVIE